ncbi:SDR family NAD(P)-dependent oxidoreductase [Rhodococcus opacus]|nr:SDR family NAD(P)-dependent oxidoreductase [Rhodococcus opacus]
MAVRRPQHRLCAREHGDGRQPPSGGSLGLGALAHRFADAGHVVVLTTRQPKNATPLLESLRARGHEAFVVQLDVGSEASVSHAFEEIRTGPGDPDVLIYNAGYMAGRELPADQELLENFPTDLFDIAIRTACVGPFLVAREVLPEMRRRGRGSILFSNNQYSLRGRRRATGESLYYPRVLMRALAQSLTEEYSELGVHVASVVVDGFIDSPGTRALEQFRGRESALLDPRSIADAFYYLHSQDPSSWTHEIQLTSAQTVPSQ